MKHSATGEATLYVIVDQQPVESKKIKAEVVKIPDAQGVRAAISRSAFEVSVAIIARFVNGKDLHSVLSANGSGHYHGLGVNTVKNLYSAIQDPIMIIAAKDIVGQNGAPRSLHSVVAIVDVGDATEHLLLPVELTATRIVGGNRMDVNVLSSSYKRSVENLAEEAIAQMYAGDIGVYYAKKEATALLSGRVSFPKQLTEAIASNGIVHRFAEKVNMEISDVTQSL